MLHEVSYVSVAVQTEPETDSAYIFDPSRIIDECNDNADVSPYCNYIQENAKLYDNECMNSKKLVVEQEEICAEDESPPMALTNDNIRNLDCNVSDSNLQVFTENGKEDKSGRLENTKNLNLLNYIKISNGKVSYNCKICPYETHKKRYFKQHMRIHINKKSLSCSLCDYKAITKSYLTYHERKHTREKSLACYSCDYKTRYKQNLERHVRTHTGVKVLGCNICEFKTNYKKCLIHHKKSHTVKDD